MTMNCQSNREKVVVTGGSGLVGKAIEEELKKYGGLSKMLEFIFLSSKDADLTNAIQTQSIFESCKPSYVINLAARVGGLYANMNDNDSSFYHVNMDINGNVLRCSSASGVKRCISCLSTCIFPANIDYPLDESKIHLGPPHESNAGYSLAKRQVDLLNRQYNVAHHHAGQGSLFTSIIPTNIYGCHDNFNLEQSHVIPGLIHKAYITATEAKSKNSKQAVLRVCGSGKPLRQFIYAPDLAKLILWTLENYNDPEPLILCPDEDDEISIVMANIGKLLATGNSEHSIRDSNLHPQKLASVNKFTFHGHDKGGFLCEVSVLLRRLYGWRLNYLDHINGKKHSKNLSINLKKFNNSKLKEGQQMLHQKRRARRDRESDGSIMRL